MSISERERIAGEVRGPDMVEMVAEMMFGQSRKAAAERLRAEQFERVAASAEVLLDAVAKRLMQ